MSASFLTPDDPAYKEVALSERERDAMLSGDATEWLENEAGQTAFFSPYPGETANEAAQRLKRHSATLRVRSLDGVVLAFYSVKPACGGRLQPWTALEIGQTMCWGYEGDDPKLALRIASYLEGRGLGRFIVFDDDEGHGQWVRRMG